MRFNSIELFSIIVQKSSEKWIIVYLRPVLKPWEVINPRVLDSIPPDCPPYLLTLIPDILACLLWPETVVRSYSSWLYLTLGLLVLCGLIGDLVWLSILSSNACMSGWTESPGIPPPAGATVSSGVATIVQGMIVQGTSCPRRLLSKGQLSKQNLVQGDFSSKVWVDKYKAAHIIFFYIL